MNPFDPANLSPLPKVQTECALPYGLTWEELQPVLPDFAGPEGSRAQAFASHDKQGLNGGANSCILTLRYPTGKNQLRSETVFIKHNADPKKAEAQKYQCITSQGVPTPRLLAVFRKGEAEVILLEFLATIGIDFRSASEVNYLLHLVAKLNAVHNPPELFNPMPGLPQTEFDELVLTALKEISHDRLFPAIDGPRWFEAYQISQEACHLMPLAVNHNELFFQQVGWVQRGSTRQLVIFDLETMCLRPRFTDIASILYPLTIYTGRDQLELFQIYLDRLHQLAPMELSFDNALRELRLVRVTEACYSIPWLVGEARNPDALDMRESLSMMVKCLREDITALGF